MQYDESRKYEIEEILGELNAQLQNHQQLVDSQLDSVDSDYHSNMCEVLMFDIFNYEEELNLLLDIAA